MIVIKDNNYIKAGCPHCDSELGIHIQDITYHEMGTYEYTTKCGACQQIFGLKSSTIPNAWKMQLAD